jgi:hypothetical protein
MRRGASGHLLHNASGHLVKACAPPSCNHCASGSPPTVIQCVLSGLTVCTACVVLSAGAKVRAGFTDPNGTYCLTFDAALSTSLGMCVYSAALPSNIIVDVYNNLNCTGGIQFTVIFTKIVVVYGASSAYIGFMTASGSTAWSPFIVNPAYTLNCSNGTWTNENLRCGLGIDSSDGTGYGGNMTTVMDGC